MTARRYSKGAGTRKRGASSSSRRPAAPKRAAARSRTASDERAPEELRRFRAAMDLSDVSICLVDRATMRFVDANATACRHFGYTSDELRRLGPQDLLASSREDLERAYDRLIANGGAAEKTEVYARRKDGVDTLVEIHRRALRRDDGWIIVHVARDAGGRDADRDRAERALRASEEKYRGILENIEDAYYEVDIKGNLVFFNSAYVRLLGYPEAELRGLNNRAYQSPDVAAKVYQTFNQVYRTGVPAKAYDWEMQRKDGSKFLVEGSVQLVRDADNRPIGFRGILRDVTSRREMEQALRESEQRFRSLIELSSDWYWEIDEHFRFARMETKRGRLETATHNHADLGKRPWESDIHAEGGWDAHRADLAAHRPFHDFVTYRRQPDGAWRYAAITGEPMFEASGDFKGYRGIGRDVTTEKIAEQRIQYLATHDGLTNLPNRVMFNELLGIAVQTAQRRASGLAVLFIDLDGFKVVNDSLGHEAGDRLLCETGNRLKQVLRGSDVVARFGGDEFVVLLQEISDVDPVATVARKILAAITQPVDLMGRLHRVTASVGISLYPSDAEEASTLLKHADAAMYVVKERGKNDFRFYPPEKSG